MIKLLLSVLLTGFITSSTQAQFAGGSGTEEDPYQIETVDQLQEIRNHTDKHFIQIADIDASETVAWNDSLGFEPIGDSEVKFTGSYNGDGYEIVGLYIDRSRELYIGLFGHIGEAEIKKVGLINSYLRGRRNVGILTGQNDGGTILDSYAEGVVLGSSSVGGLVGTNKGSITNSYAIIDVTGEYGSIGGLVGRNEGTIIGSSAKGEVTTTEIDEAESIGGLVGRNQGGIITDCYTEVNLTGDGAWAGGLVGQNQGSISNSYANGDVTGWSSVGGLVGTNKGSIINSYANGDVTGEFYAVGGLVGNNKKGSISNSYATGDVTGESDTVGGLVGFNYAGSINKSNATGDVIGKSIIVGGFVGGNAGSVTDSYSTGNATGENTVGGFVGRNWDYYDVQITYSYSTGKPSGNIDVGGFAGLNEASIKMSYWDTETSESTEGVASGEADDLTGLTTHQMTGTLAYEYMNAFDFSDTWLLTENYPALHWEDVETLPTRAIDDEDNAQETPEDFTLSQNYPNPFNPSTQIRFAVPEQTQINLAVYNMLGQRVTTLVNESRSPGWHDVTFDASELSSGLYIYRLEADGFVETKSMMFVK